MADFFIRMQTIVSYLPSHVTPSPEYPVWHAQKNDPLVLVQLAWLWQLWAKSWYSLEISLGKHSLMSKRDWEVCLKQAWLPSSGKKGISTCYHGWNVICKWKWWFACVHTNAADSISWVTGKTSTIKATLCVRAVRIDMAVMTATNAFVNVWNIEIGK